MTTQASRRSGSAIASRSRSAGRCPMLVPGRWAAPSPRCGGDRVRDPLHHHAPPCTAARGPARQRRALRALSSTLIVLGVLALLDVGVTLVWQEPFSALYAKLQQDHLRGALRTLEHAEPTARENARLLQLAGRAPARVLPGGRARPPRRARQRGGQHPHPPDRRQLRAGVRHRHRRTGEGAGDLHAEHLPGHPLPRPGWHHRDRRPPHHVPAPFRHIDELRRGRPDPGGHALRALHLHRDRPPQRAAPPTCPPRSAHAGYSRLVLSACTPLFSAAERLLVYARLTRTIPVGARARRRRGLTPRRSAPPPPLRAPLPQLRA